MKLHCSHGLLWGNKSYLSGKVFPIILGIINTGHKVKYLRLDNAGENWDLENKCLHHLLGINFEYTTPNTPQFNGVVERKFQSIYNKLRATLFESGLTYELSNLLWDECASTVTTLDNICVGKRNKKSPHELFYKEKPKIANNLRIFGEIGIVKNYKLKHKLHKKGDHMIFIGYPERHSSSSYRMYNVGTGGICISRYILVEQELQSCLISGFQTEYIQSTK